MAHTNNNRIPCYKALHLLNLHLWNDPSLTDQDRATFQFHLQHCHKCAEEYKDAKWVLGLVKKYWGPISEGTHELPEEGVYPIPEQEATLLHRTRPMTVEESWEDLKRRSPSLARRQEEKGRRRSCCEYPDSRGHSCKERLYIAVKSFSQTIVADIDTMLGLSEGLPRVSQIVSASLESRKFMGFKKPKGWHAYGNVRNTVFVMN